MSQAVRTSLVCCMASKVVQVAASSRGWNLSLHSGPSSSAALVTPELRLSFLALTKHGR